MKNVEDVYPLSPMQEGMLFHTLLTPGSGVYVVLISSLIEGEFNIPLFKRAWQIILDRHSILRSAFLWEGVDHPLQVVRKELALAWDESDWSDMSEDIQEQKLQDYLTSEHRSGFDLAQAPLMRMALIRFGPARYQFVWGYSHLLLDGWSVNLLWDEMFAHYKALSHNRASDIPKPRPYRDFIGWLKKQDQEQAETFWGNMLRDFTEPTPLPSETIRPPFSSQPHRETTLQLTPELTATLKRVARHYRLTLSTFIQGAWALLLANHTRLPEVVFGVTVTGRPVTLDGVNSLVGLLVNTLPLRVQILADEQLWAWLRRIQDLQVKMREYEYSSLIDIKKWSDIPPSLPLFESFVVFENYPVTTGVQNLDGNVRLVSNRVLESAAYPLMFLAEPGDRIRLRIMFDTSRFRPETVESLLKQIVILLEQMAHTPERRLREVSLLTAGEREQVLVDWNHTKRPYRTDSVVALFEEQAQLNPSVIAVEYDDTCFSYAELNCRANQLARKLQQMGVSPDFRVGLFIERSLDMVVGLLGVLKAGGAYVPLDPGYPEERLSHMLGDAQMSVLLSQAQLRVHLPPFSGKLIELDTEWPEIAQYPTDNLNIVIHLENLAYVIYTSGSTGRPKGVMNTHGGLTNRLQWMPGLHPLAIGDRVLQKTPFSFDVSVWELLGTLSAGATLIMARPGGHQDPEYLSEVIENHQITTLHFVPSMLAPFLDQDTPERWKSVKKILCGGEALDPALSHKCRALIPWAELHNVYGPTETAIDVSSWHCEVENGTGTVPIGRGISNTTLYVLDDELEPVPVGVAGELYIGGVGLARGYWGRADQTAERFVPDHLGGRRGERLYRTGDLTRWRPDGAVEFLGRIDHQIKIRGYRIELGEIEAILSQYPGIRKTLLVVSEDRASGAKNLVAYYTSDTTTQIDSAKLRAYLLSVLPEYMVPSLYVQLQHFPLTPNGKVDRRGLPTPNRMDQLIQHSEPPRNETERLVAQVFCELLEIEKISRDDSFFALGGHSLLATRAISKLRQRHQIQLPLRSLFETPTVTGLADRITQDKKGTSSLREGILIETRPEFLPLSFAQERLWLLNQLNPEGAAYTISAAMRVEGILNIAAMEATIAEIIERHENLRTRFESRAGVPFQVIDAPAPVAMTSTDLSGLDSVEQVEEVSRLARLQAIKPFDLSRGPLLRASLFRLADREHVVLLTMHHIIWDGWSTGVMLREIATIYPELAAGRRPIPLKPLRLQYADFSVWQRKWLSGDVLKQQQAYWRGQLEGAPNALELPSDRLRKAEQSSRGNRLHVQFSAELSARLNRLARREGATLFMLLLSAFSALLSRWSGQEDIVIGTPIANRTNVEIEELIGVFVNTLALRTKVTGDPTFLELLKQVRENTLSAYANQDLPFEYLVEMLQPDRDRSRHPIFQVMLVLQNTPRGALELPGLRLSSVDVAQNTAKFDIMLSLAEYPEGLGGEVEYSTDLFEKETIERFVRQFTRFLEGAVFDPTQRVKDMKIMSESEILQTIYGWNDTFYPVPETNVVKLFETQAERNPDAVAVVFGDTSLSYAQLNQRAEKLAHVLNAEGVRPERIVGLCMERSLEMLVALLGILKAGGAYLPLAPEYPPARLQFLIEDAKPICVLTEGNTGSVLPPGVRQIRVDEATLSYTKRGADTNLNVMPSGELRGEHPAYLLYTSGSTGMPKGVLVEHKSLANRILWMQSEFELQPDDRVLQKTPYTFDVSVWEFFWPLSVGATLVVAKPHGHQDPRYIARLVREEQITTIHFVPSMLRAFLQTNEAEGIRCFRRVICSGEALSPELQASFYTMINAPLYNLYGPTEATIDVSSWACIPEGSAAAVPIGRPIWNTQLYVLDEKMRPVPPGMVGELWIAGVGLARCYLHRAELTAERFVPDPYGEPGRRMYRSGDLARWRDDGALEYWGRIDDQVKIRGFRIELGEIEAALTRHSGVAQAAVGVWHHVSGDKRLVAYFVPVSDRRLAFEELREYLTERLPGYMVPSHFVCLQELPLTGSGKLDRKSLPPPDPFEGADAHVKPTTPEQEILCGIWSDVLGLTEVGIQDNFFELGGHSLLGTQVLSRVREIFSIDLPLRSIFDFPTVAQFSTMLSSELMSQIQNQGDGLKSLQIN